MLYNISVPNPPAVYEKTTMNYGNLENTGWEFEIGGVPVKTKDFNWTTTMRLSHSSSKITSLWGNNTYQDRVGFPSPGTNGSAGRIEAEQRSEAIISGNMPVSRIMEDGFCMIRTTM